MGLSSQRCSPRQKMGVSASVDELIQLERKALSTVPFVKLERLQLDAEGNPVVSPEMSDGLAKVKQEPLEINWFKNATVLNEYEKESNDEEQRLPPEITMPAVRPKLPRPKLPSVRSERRSQKSRPTGRMGQTSSREPRSFITPPSTVGSPQLILPQGIKVFMFTCGHACSKCNKGTDRKWLNDKGFKTVAPCSNRIAKGGQHELLKKLKDQSELAQKILPRPEYVATLTHLVNSQALASQHSSTPKRVSTITQPALALRPRLSPNPAPPSQIPLLGLAQLPQMQSPLISTNSASVLDQISQVSGGLSKQISLPPMVRLSQAQLPLQSPAVVTPNISVNNHLQILFANQTQSNNVTLGSVSSAASHALNKPQGTSSHTDSTHSDVQINEETRKVLLKSLRHKNPAISNQTTGEAGLGMVLPCSPDSGSLAQLAQTSQLSPNTQPDAQTQLGLSVQPGPQTQLSQSAPCDEHTQLAQPCETVNSSDVSDSELVQSLQQVLDANPNAKILLSNVPRK